MKEERDLFSPPPPVLHVEAGPGETARIPWTPPPTAADVRKAFDDSPTLAERFAAFHKENPAVYAALVRFAREAKGKGAKALGIRMLWERARWDLTIDVADPAGARPKMNDHYVPIYARLIMAQEKDLAGLFETREMADPAGRKA